MTAPKNPRVTITPKALHALNIQAAIEKTTPGLLASRLILDYSKEANRALQERETPSEEGSLTPREEGSQAPLERDGGRGPERETPIEVRSPNTRAVVREVGILPEREAPPERREKKKRLFQNPQALEEIKRLWEGGQRNQAEISRAIGYDRATVNDNIRKMIKAGELSPKDQ